MASEFELDRRRFLGSGLALAAGGVAACSSLQGERRFDTVLRGGSVLDGSGAAAFEADIAVRGERIAAIGSFDAASAARVIDARGLCVAPGFVDIHTHSDRTIFEWPGADSRVRQGCTTEVTGNCGSSAAPRDPRALDEDDQGRAPTWTDVRSYAAAWEANDAALNHALLVGHGSLRRSVMGDVDRAATEDELALMVRRLELALEQGAIGLSSGLEYVPGIYTPAAELERLARSVAAKGGLYASHMRSEEEHLLDAVRETIDIGRKTGVRVQVSHLKAAGRPNWGSQDAALELLENARAEGLDVLADAYPYTAYSTTLTILLEAWSREGGAEEIAKRLADPAARARMLREVGPHVQRDPGGFELVVISSVASPALQECLGKSLAQIAELWSVEPAEAYLRLLEGARAEVSYVGHGMSAENVERVLAHPLVMIGSDGRSMAPTGSAADDRPHPRSYGTFPRVLGHYCRERKLFDLPTAVRKMTSMPAERARLSDRGRIAPGAFADLVVFDAATVTDVATFDDPQRYPRGILHVLVNGQPVVERGAPTGARPGRWLASV
ncbi:MAG: D-aminoacylase [Planctomycetes bacterium]|nr:D-aminoacylase [Planctomycetota bacterium]